MDVKPLSKAKRTKLIYDVALALSRNGYTHFLSLETLTVATLNEKTSFMEEEMYSIEESPDNYLQILPYSDADRQELRRRFVQKIGDEVIRAQLLAAINSYDPATAYLKALKKYSDISQQWHQYRDDHFEAEAEQWLYENGLGAFVGISKK